MLQEMSNEDKRRHNDFCNDTRHSIESKDNFLDRIVFRDKTKIYIECQGNLAQCLCLGKMGHKGQSDKVNVFCTMSQMKIQEPFIFSYEKTVICAAANFWASWNRSHLPEILSDPALVLYVGEDISKHEFPKCFHRLSRSDSTVSIVFHWLKRSNNMVSKMSFLYRLAIPKIKVLLAPLPIPRQPRFLQLLTWTPILPTCGTKSDKGEHSLPYLGSRTEHFWKYASCQQL
jgi:hypothetical protein